MSTTKYIQAELPTDALKAVLLKVLSVAMMSGMIACIKASSDQVPPGQAVFFRALFALPVVVSWLLIRGNLISQIKTRRPGGHLLRGALGALAMIFSFSAAGLLPLAQATALSYGTPVFILVLAVLLLGEPRHVFRALSVVVGLAGIVIVLWPDLVATFGGNAATVSLIGVAAALLSCLAHALGALATRTLTRTESNGTIVFWFTVVAVCVGFASSMFPVFGLWQMPDIATWLLLLAAGVFGALGQIALTTAFSLAHTSTIAPFEYVSIVFAITVGYWAFGEVPSLWTAAGVFIIFWGALIMVRGESRLKRSRLAELGAKE